MSADDIRSSTALGVFLKAPEPGRVKTRLARTIGATAAVALYREWVRETLRAAVTSCADRVTVFYAPADAEAACRGLAPDPSLDFVPQTEGDLGQRLDGAFRDLLPASRNVGRAAIIGTDCPELSSEIVDEAFARLRVADLVLGPALDGGYFLVGLREPRPTLFEGIAWSTAQVLQETLARAGDLRSELLAPLRDVDTIEDLRALVRSWELDPETHRERLRIARTASRWLESS